MSTSYRTVARRAEAEIEVRRSRFLATVAPVADEAEARALTEEMRRRHHDARHHCTAFILGPGARVERSHDDGEPAGTAGAPMLEVLRGAGLSDVAVVVTRWFGGTLLGAGGLVRAYGDSVRAVLPAAGVRVRSLLLVGQVVVEPAEAGRVEAGLREHGVALGPVHWAEQVTLEVAFPGTDHEGLAGWLATLTSGRATLTVTGERWS